MGPINSQSTQQADGIGGQVSQTIGWPAGQSQPLLEQHTIESRPT